MRLDGESLQISGSAPGSSQVRLATPEGKALFAEADAKGGWRLATPRGSQPQIYGLSATGGGRTVQSEGYLLLTPDGEAALLRAGTGALRVGRTGKNDLDAVDFDREGGAVVSGRRQIDVFGDATENPVEIEATPAAALSSGPFRAAAVAAGLRVDWMTPGGGVQSTILLK